MVYIDALTHDHILNTILLHSPARTWLLFRATSRLWRDEMDRRLARHLVIVAPAHQRALGDQPPKEGEVRVSCPGLARLPSLLGADEGTLSPPLRTALGHTHVLDLVGFVPRAMLQALAAHATSVRSVRVRHADDMRLFAAWNRVRAVPFPSATEVVVQVFNNKARWDEVIGTNIPPDWVLWDVHPVLGETLNLPPRVANARVAEAEASAIVTAPPSSPNRELEHFKLHVPAEEGMEGTDPVPRPVTPHVARLASHTPPPRVIVVMPDTVNGWIKPLLPRLTSLATQYDEQHPLSPSSRPPSPPHHQQQHQQIVLIFPGQALFQRGHTLGHWGLPVVTHVWEKVVGWSAELLGRGCAVTFVNLGQAIWRDVVDKYTGVVTNPWSAAEDAQAVIDRYWFDYELTERRVLEPKMRARLRFLSTDEYAAEVGVRVWERETTFAPKLPLCEELYV
ncbi:uncharacterized protein LOC62_04G006089 [Vanrija pseudolonga]|uniref:Uncharacterized protein n=1 Tax=Vanrija pseudolonga TaxID=143232 RepID=A0AAF0YD14_9TREE|nr:hypothetical protein LOC62_04G006089 [Vanrija pseudolonga]